METVPSPMRLAGSGYFLDLLSLQEDPGKRTWVGPGLGLRSPLLQPSPWPDSTPGRNFGAWGQLDKSGFPPCQLPGRLHSWRHCHGNVSLDISSPLFANHFYECPQC